MSRIPGTLLLPLLLAVAPGTALAGAPVVAVFTVELRGVPGGPRLAEALTAYLSSRLGETGRFEVVPRDRLQRALAAKRRESYRQCYAQSCQIAIGQEVAASLALATQVHRIGGSCVMMSNLFDLRKATAGTAGTARGGCSENALLKLVDGVVNRLARRDGDTAPKGPGPRFPAELLVVGSPDGARVAVTAPAKPRRECTLPCHLSPIPPGTYTVEVSTPGFLAQRRTVTVSPGRAVAIYVELHPGTADEPAPQSAPAPQPEPVAPAGGAPLCQGLQVAPLTPASRERRAVPPQVNFGVVVDRVAPGSWAAKRGLQVGDVILEVNGAKIETVAGLHRALGHARGRVKVMVHRQNRSLVLP